MRKKFVTERSKSLIAKTIRFLELHLNVRVITVIPKHVLTRSGLGFAAGATAGLGISYRKHLANKIGYQLTGIAWGDNSSLFLSMGANFLKTLHATKRTRFLAIAGVSTYYRANNSIDYNDCRVVSPEEWEANPNIDPCEGLEATWRHGATINVGVGIGMNYADSKCWLSDRTSCSCHDWRW